MSCDRRCKTARTPESQCECSCGGANHGNQTTLNDVGITVEYCEHVFEEEDPNNTGYSLTEVDLASRHEDTPLAIRKNHDRDRFEIFGFTHDNPYSDEAVHYHYSTARQCIQTAREIEKSRFGSSGLAYGHTRRHGCPPETLEDEREKVIG